MPVPQIGLLQAFAIGIPIGIAGFAVQEVFIRRRLARSPSERTPAKKTDFGPREEAQKDPGDGAAKALDVTSPPLTVTKPSRTRPKKAVARSANKAAPGVPVKPFVSPAKKAVVAAGTGASDAAPGAVKPGTPATGAKPVRAPKRAATAGPTAAPAPVPGAAPIPVPRATAVTKRQTAPLPAPETAVVVPGGVVEKGPGRALRRRETSLDAALDAVVEFVDGAARRARAEACAAELTRLVPKSYQGPALATFASAVASGRAPGELKDLAEDVGIELARHLQAVRQEMSNLA